MPAGYVPDAGDIVWMNFDPRHGREQAGHRPAVVLTPASYNARAGLLVCCPTTTRIKGYPFEVALGGPPASVVLVDHVRSVNWRSRSAVLKGRATVQELGKIRVKLLGLLG